MGLFVHDDDAGFDPDVRPTGFNRYKQLLSLHAIHWIKLNLLTVAGALPLAAGIVYSILSSSILVLIPCSIIGGMLWGPFIAGLYDGILRALRDAPDRWWDAYKKSWRQNWRDSLLPGAVTGLLLGMYCFMGAMLWWSQTAQGPGTVLLFVFSFALFLLIGSLYWNQLVLFSQTVPNRLRNILLFTAKHLWRVLGVTALRTAYYLLFVLLAPWTLLLVPFLGLWYIVFLSQLLLYDRLNEDFQIEPQLSEPP